MANAFSVSKPMHPAVSYRANTGEEYKTANIPRVMILTFVTVCTLTSFESWLPFWLNATARPPSAWLPPDELDVITQSWKQRSDPHL